MGTDRPRELRATPRRADPGDAGEKRRRVTAAARAASGKSLIDRHAARFDRRRPLLDFAADEAFEIVGAGAIGSDQIGSDRFHANAQRRHIHGFDRSVMQTRASNHWPMMLRLGAVCTIAAMVAAAVVFLFSPKQIAHKIAQANASDDATPASIESSRDVPALSVETSAPTAPLAQGQVAIATPPQLPQTELAATPQPAEGQVAAAPPPKPEQRGGPAALAQQLAS